METRREVEEELTSHFKVIMTEDNNERDQYITQITGLIPKKVTKDYNEMLSSPISVIFSF